MSRRNIHLLALLLAALLVPLSAPCADGPQKSQLTGTVSPEARPLIEKAVQAAGGKTNLLGTFTFKDNVRLGETDKGFGAKRESVMDAPRHWWHDVTEVTPLKELPEKLQPAQPVAK